MNESFTKKVSRFEDNNPRMHPATSHTDPDIIQTSLYLTIAKCILVIAGLYIIGWENSNALIAKITSSAVARKNKPPIYESNRRPEIIARNAEPTAID